MEWNSGPKNGREDEKESRKERREEFTNLASYVSLTHRERQSSLMGHTNTEREREREREKESSLMGHTNTFVYP